MTKKASFFIGMGLGVIPQILIIFVVKFVSTEIGFDGAGVMVFILFLISLFIVVICLGIFLISAFKNKYIGFGIITVLILTVLLSFTLQVTNKFMYDIHGNKIIANLKKKYNDDFFIQNDHLSISNLDPVEIILYGILLFFPDPSQIGNEFNYNLVSKNDNKFNFKYKGKVGSFKGLDDIYKYNKEIYLKRKEVYNSLLKLNFERIIDEDNSLNKSNFIYKTNESMTKIKIIVGKVNKRKIELKLLANIDRDNYNFVFKKAYEVFKMLDYNSSKSLKFYDFDQEIFSYTYDYVNYWIAKSKGTYISGIEENTNSDVIMNYNDFKMGLSVRRGNQLNTPLMIAILSSNTNKINEFLYADEFINETNINGETPLTFAIRQYNMDLINKLLNCNAIVNPKNRNMKCPLAVAIEENNYEIAKYLIENGSKIDIKDGRRQPIQIALDKFFDQEIDLSIIKLLVENGSDINYVDRNNKISCLIRAELHKNKELYNYLLKFNGKKRVYDYLSHVSEDIKKENRNASGIKFFEKHKDNIVLGSS